MNLKSKIILLAVVPLIVSTVMIIYLSLQHARELAKEELSIYEFNLLQAKKEALKSHMNIALSAIRPILDSRTLSDTQAKAAVKRVINRLRYGDDGYFYVYSRSGVNLVHPIQPELVGKNLWDFQDKSGDFLIQNLIAVAKSGGGFHRYFWKKPPFMVLEEKIGYAVMIDRWHWMLGTGLYVGDVYVELSKVKATMNDNIQRSFFSVIVVVIITVIFVVFLGLAINLHEHKLADSRLKEMAQRFMRMQVNERRGFSRELHDGINQLLVSCKFRVELAGNKLKREHDEEKVQQELLKASDMISQTINEVRQISHNLRPTLLDDLGLDTALRSVIDQFSERTGIEVEYRFDVLVELADEIEISVYRLTQEALTNVEKHAQASRVVLNLWILDQQLEFECKDNGIGLLADIKSCSGIGLINMRERLELIGGSFFIESHKSKGTRIYAVLPV